MFTKLIYPIQVGISFLIISLCIAIIGSAGHVLSVYDDEKDSNLWWLPLWSNHFDAGGTRVLIGSAATVVVMNTVFLALISLSLFNLKTHPTLRAILLIFTTLPAASLTLGSFVYAIKLNNRSPDVDTIETWTCRAKNEVRGDDIQFSPEASNEGFSRLCTESRFALYAMVTVFALQALILVGVLFGCSAERRKRKVQRVLDEEAEEAENVQLQQLQNIDAMKQQVHANVTVVA